MLRRIRRLGPPQVRPAILMYHRIADESFDPWGLAVSPSRFADHLHWLGRSRRVLPLDEFVARHGARELPANAVALTFDDGYSCVAEIAAPMLEKARLPATIFIPAESIERGRPFWWDELRELVLSHDEDHLILHGTRFELGPRHSDDGRWPPGARPHTSRQAAFRRIWTELKEKTPAELEVATEQLRSQVRGTAGAEVPRPMSPEQVRKTSSDRIRFGSHALTHPWLTRLSDAEKRREILGSVERIEALSGRRPSAFAYPYGNFDRTSERLVEEAGFVCACATIGDPVSVNSRPFAMPRIAMGNWSSQEIRERFGD